MSKNIVKKALIKYKTKKYSLEQIANEICVDKRTLKKFWLEMYLTTHTELKKLTNKTKYLGFLDQKKGTIISDSELDNILLYIENNNRQKFTISNIRTELNLKYSARHILKRLKEKYDDTILSYFKLGDKSNIEIDFFGINC